jgi:hypothetical protein
LVAEPDVRKKPKSPKKGLSSIMMCDKKSSHAGQKKWVILYRQQAALEVGTVQEREGARRS